MLQTWQPFQDASKEEVTGLDSVWIEGEQFKGGQSVLGEGQRAVKQLQEKGRGGEGRGGRGGEGEGRCGRGRGRGGVGGER